MHCIYLDNNATTQPDPRVVRAMRQALEETWANPSSVHRPGQAARQAVELARAALAALLGCRDRELVFTSGGTEANNLALAGTLLGAPAAPAEAPPPVLLTTRIEHTAIRQPAEELLRRGVQVAYVPVDADGGVAPDALADALRRHLPAGARALVSIQWANNETGVIQPVAELVEVCRRHERDTPGTRLTFHCDATQAVGKLPVSVNEAGVDLLSLAAHKFHGPKGVGALYVRAGGRVRPQVLGGPQERERRGGTENVPGIVGLGAAAELAGQFLADPAAVEAQRRLRDRFEQGIRAALPDTVINSAGRPRLWNTSNLGFPRLEAEALLLGLSERGLCASAGAACSSGSLEPSPVLLAMGIAPEVAHGSVRFSLSRFTTPAEIEQAVELVPQVVTRLGQTMPMGTGISLPLL